jgi:hypothetical protein
MRPDDLLPGDTGVARRTFDLPIDVDLASVDRELALAGAHARRALFGRTQPTRVFSGDVRAWLLRRFGGPASPGPDRRR